jgi:hypothetical protein
VLPGSVAIFIVGRNRAFGEQAGKIVGVYGVAQEKRAGHMEDFLQGAQIVGSSPPLLSVKNTWGLCFAA